MQPIIVSCDVESPREYVHVLECTKFWDHLYILCLLLLANHWVQLFVFSKQSHCLVTNVCSGNVSVLGMLWMQQLLPCALIHVGVFYWAVRIAIDEERVGSRTFPPRSFHELQTSEQFWDWKGVTSLLILTFIYSQPVATFPPYCHLTVCNWIGLELLFYLGSL